jgi:hypothetical protein
MSRTYRRKDSEWNFNYNHNDYYYSTGFRSRISYDSIEYIDEKKKFHREKKSFNQSVPNWYCNLYYQRPERRKSKAIIQKWMMNSDTTECIIDKSFKCAGYDYW